MTRKQEQNSLVKCMIKRNLEINFHITKNCIKERQIDIILSVFESFRTIHEMKNKFFNFFKKATKIQNFFK